MPAIINDNFDLRAPKSIDGRYLKISTPYATTTEAHTLITYKYVGLLVIIGSSVSNFRLYWYKGGTNLEHLVPASVIEEEVVPPSRQVNSHALTSNITIVKADVGLSNVLNIDTTQASNLLSGIIPSARYGSTTIPTSSINATGGGVDDFLSKGGVWKQPDAQNIYFSTKFSGTGELEDPVDISTTFLKVPSYTTTQRDALTGMLDGDTIYNNTTKALESWDALTSAWV